jgi:hypothetical protein
MKTKFLRFEKRSMEGDNIFFRSTSNEFLSTKLPECCLASDT